MVVGTYTHLDDMLASQYQSINCTQHIACKLTAYSWGNLLAPGTMYEKTSGHGWSRANFGRTVSD